MLSSLINFFDMRLIGLTVYKISAYLSIAAIFVTLATLIAIISKLFKFSRDINENMIKELNSKYSPLISDLR